jgi:hypothetical protein
MDGHVFRGFDSEAHSVSTYLHDEDRHIVIDDDTFVYFSSENQHGNSFFRGGV